MPIKSYYHSLGGAKPATGGKCSYECNPNRKIKHKKCQVYFEANGALSDRGFCSQSSRRCKARHCRQRKSWRCFATPKLCRDCNERCNGRWGTNFSELVGSEISGSQEEITPPPPPPMTTIRPGN